MTADGTALLRAVLASPDDDAPRLVYADWLDDHDRPAWAEFIRAQVAAARDLCPNTWVPPREACASPDCRSCRTLRDRAAELRSSPDFWESVWGGWQAPVGGAWYARGFIESVSVTADRFVVTAGRLFSLHPIQRVRLTDRSAALTTVGAAWYCGGQMGPEWAKMSVVPKAVYDLMRPPPWAPRLAPDWIAQAYPTHADANRALSDACVAYGRWAAEREPKA